MKLEPADLQAITAALTEHLQQLTKLGSTERLGYSEAEAAALLGIARHVLRDARLRGEITARKVGKQYLYSRQALVCWLNSQDNSSR